MHTRLQLVVGVVMELTLLGLVVGLVALGHRSLGRGLTLFVDYDRVENLKEGAEVRISSMVVGRVIAIRQGATAGEPAPLARIRVQVWLERAQAHHVRRNSAFTVNSKGPIGERYIEVGPPPGDPAAGVSAGEALRGVDSPAMDRLIQFGYDTLRFGRAWERDLEPDIHAVMRAADSVRAHLEELRAGAHLARIGSAANEAISTTRELWDSVQAGTDRMRAPRRLAEKLASIGQRDGDTLADVGERARQLARKLDLLEDLLPPGERGRAERSLDRLKLAASQGEQALALLQKLRARVQSGRGTLGRMLADEEMADEIKEAHRLLKESPWRALRRAPEDRAPSGARRRPVPTP